ncbi:hypothetical protein LTR09_003510 [Extremus antarcticus]|uniref:Transposase MuDR plant domain-containing protein n=1 Tax=Extremus antarcticus TaxID=702011 RepID=A0AAJ0DSK0_9PEZI|nr:hypothetical protein LTR09_003510 [Extremus antarcticus]
MSEKIDSLRLQVNAAEFLLRSLQEQLKEAEQGAQQHNSEDSGIALRHAEHHMPASSGNRGNRTRLEVNENIIFGGAGLDGGGGGADEDQPGFGDEDAPTDEDAPGESVDDAAQAYELPPLEVGTMYPSLEEIKKATVAHAISQGWTCGVDKRDKTRLLLKCRSDPSCPFHLRAEQYEKAARVSSYKPEHTCTFQPDQSHVPRGHATKLKFMREQLPNFMRLDDSTTAQDISDAIFQRFGTRVSLKQCGSLRVGPKRKRAQGFAMCSTCGELGHNKKTCGRIRGDSNP